MKLGTRVEGKRIPLPKDYLVSADSVKGHIYEIVIKTDKKVDDITAMEIANRLAYELPKRFNAELLYFENYDNYIIMDVKGSPFAWSALLAWLPEILMLVGLTVLTISVFLVISSNPWLAFAMFFGLMSTAFGYYLLKKREEAERKAVESVTGVKIPVE